MSGAKGSALAPAPTGAARRRDESTRDVSLLEVEPADLYVGIIGGRYGSGITEAEYRRALELKLPCLIYFKDESTIGPDHEELVEELIVEAGLRC